MDSENRSANQDVPEIAPCFRLKVQAEAFLNGGGCLPKSQVIASEDSDPDTSIEMEQSEAQSDEDPDIDQDVPGGELPRRLRLTVRAESWVELAPIGPATRPADSKSAQRLLGQDDGGLPGPEDVDDSAPHPDEPIEAGQSETNPAEEPDIDQPANQN